MLQSITKGGYEFVEYSNVNLLENTGFENIHYDKVNDAWIEKPEMAEAWTSWSSTANGYTATRTTSAAKTDNFGYDISRTTNGVAAVQQIYGGVVPEETYKLSGWFKVPSGSISGSGAALTVEVIDADLNKIGTSKYSPRKATGSSWEQLSLNFTLPEDGRFVRISAELDGTGKVYIDDLMLEAILIESVTREDAATSPILYNYDAVGKLAQVTQTVANLSNGAQLETINTYEHDRIKSLTHNGFVYNFTYDVWGNPNIVKIGTSNLVMYGFGITGNRNLNSITYANGQIITYIYDSKTNEVTGVSVDGDSVPEYTYSYTDRQLRSITDTVAETVTTFIGENIEVRSTVDNSLIYSINGNVENFRGQKYTTTIEKQPAYNTLSSGEKAIHDAEKQRGITTSIIKTTGAANYTNTKKTDYFGRILTKQVQVGDLQLQNTYEYVALPGGRTTKQIASQTNKIDGQDFQNFAYTYDTNGNVTEVKLDNIIIASYMYDEAGQLTDETTSEGTTTWEYDTGGNIVSKTLPDSTEIAYTYDSIWKDKLTGYDGQTIAYDAIGNPLSYFGNTLAWTGRQLASFNDITFTYDADGLRTSKTVNNVTTQYTLFNRQLIGQTDGTNTLYFLYDDETINGFNLNGTDIYFYLKNMQGDVTGIIDSEGDVVVEYAYDAWGNPSEPTGSAANTLGTLNPIRYRGYYYDIETGFYATATRYYDPEIGRFINADLPTMLLFTGEEILGANLFVYCQNNPVNYYDPIGMWGSGIHTGTSYGTYKWATDNCKMSAAHADIVAKANQGVDGAPTGAWVPGFQNRHFKAHGAETYANNRKNDAVNGWKAALKENNTKNKNDKKEKALKELGKGLHAKQDVYAHLGWNIWSDGNWMRSMYKMQGNPYKLSIIHYAGTHTSWSENVGCLVYSKTATWSTSYFDDVNYFVYKGTNGGYIHVDKKNKEDNDRYKDTRKYSIEYIDSFKSAAGYTP